MIAQQVRQPVPEAQRIEEAKLDPCIEQPPAIGPREPEGAEPVEHHAHPRAAARGPPEGVDEARGDRARAHQIHLEQHVAARLLDRREHAREELAAVVQQAKLVSESPRPARGCRLLEIRLRRHVANNERPADQMPDPAAARRAARGAACAARRRRRRDRLCQQRAPARLGRLCRRPGAAPGGPAARRGCSAADAGARAARPRAPNATLARARAQYARDMATCGYMDHTGRDGSSPEERITRSGYRWRETGENLASGIMTPEDAVAGWLRSPEHCANLMDPAFRHMGVAYAVNPRLEAGVYWAQEFGTPR